jgi:hypothetical protein
MHNSKHLMSNVFTSESKRSTRKFGNREVDYDREEVDRWGDNGCGRRNNRLAGDDSCRTRSWWGLWAGIIVFVIFGIGFWVVKPSWVLAKDLSGAIELPLSIDWLKLFVTDLIVTLVLLFLAWAIRCLSEGWFCSSW